MARNCRYQSGLSMVEILVAALIGLIGVVIVTQVMTQSEAGRRTTSNVAGSQTSGQLAMFLMERDLMHAGQGIVLDNLVFNYASTATPSPLNCRISSNLPNLAFNNLPLAPAVIIPAGVAAGNADNLWNIPQGDANSDMIAVAYAGATAMAEGMNMAANSDPTPPVYALSSIKGINNVPGEIDYMVVSDSANPKPNCTLARATGLDLVNNTVTLDYDAGIAYGKGTSLYNLGPSNLAPSTLAARAPRFAVYAVRNGVLTVCDFFANGGTDCTNAGSVNDPNVWTPVMENVVALQAQYGWETTNPADGVTDAFCKTRLGAGAVCPGTDNGSPAPTAAGGLTAAQQACDWTRVTAVRFAIVTRSDQYEKTAVSPATIKLWPDSVVAPLTTGPVYAVPDRNYRYRVFQASVALRSTISIGGDPTVRATSVCY